MSDKISVGDFVWARMKGFPAWPSQVIPHPFGERKIDRHYVFFFGSYDYAWISAKNIFPYLENVTKFSTKSRQRGYQEALIAIAKAYQESIAGDEEAGTSGTSEQNDEEPEIAEPVQGDDEYVFKKKRIRTPAEEEERQRLINKRLRVKLWPKNDKKNTKVIKKKRPSNKNHVVTVNVKDYKKVITKEVVILLKRCDE